MTETIDGHPGLRWTERELLTLITTHCPRLRAALDQRGDSPLEELARLVDILVAHGEYTVVSLVRGFIARSAGETVTDLRKALVEAPVRYGPAQFSEYFACLDEPQASAPKGGDNHERQPRTSEGASQAPALPTRAVGGAQGGPKKPEYEPKTPEQALGYLVEEAGETLAAAGKALRWGLESTDPELAPEKQETNAEWLKRESADLRASLDRLDALVFGKKAPAPAGTLPPELTLMCDSKVAHEYVRFCRDRLGTLGVATWHRSAAPPGETIWLSTADEARLRQWLGFSGSRDVDGIVAHHGDLQNEIEDLRKQCADLTKRIEGAKACLRDKHYTGAQMALCNGVDGTVLDIEVWQERVANAEHESKILQKRVEELKQRVESAETDARYARQAHYEELTKREQLEAALKSLRPIAEEALRQGFRDGTSVLAHRRQRVVDDLGALDAAKPAKKPSPDEGTEHLFDGEFQSDKYPTCPRGKVPLSTRDPMAQDLLSIYAQRRRSVDAQFAADLEKALALKDYPRSGVPFAGDTPESLAREAYLYKNTPPANAATDEADFIAWLAGRIRQWAYGKWVMR